MEDQVEEIWRHVDDTLRGALPPEVYRVWIEPLVPAGIQDGVLYLKAPDRGRVGRATVRRSAGRGGRRPSGDQPDRGDRRRHAPAPGRRLRTPRPQAELYVRRFVIAAGEPLRARRRAGGRRAARPGLQPALHLRRPGVGKTHLLQAIGNYVTLCVSGSRSATRPRRRSPASSWPRSSARICRPSSGATARSTSCCSTTSSSSRARSKTAEEFFYTVEAAHQRAAPSSCSPRTARRAAMPLLHSPLKERFESGLLVDIAAPGQAVKLRGPAAALAGPRPTSSPPAACSTCSPSAFRQRALTRERTDPLARVRIPDPAAPHARAGRAGPRR